MGSLLVQILVGLGGGLVGALVTIGLARLIARHRATYGSAYLAFVCAYLTSLAVGAVAGLLGLVGGIWTFVLILAAFTIQVLYCARMIVDDDKVPLGGGNAFAVTLIQTLIFALVWWLLRMLLT